MAWLPLAAMLSAGLAAGLQPWQERGDANRGFTVNGKVVDEADRPVSGVDVGDL